eukprot:2105745-Pyramimonas_sp.AAC.1
MSLVKNTLERGSKSKRPMIRALVRKRNSHCWEGTAEFRTPLRVGHTPNASIKESPTAQAEPFEFETPPAHS